MRIDEDRSYRLHISVGELETLYKVVNHVLENEGHEWDEVDQTIMDAFCSECVNWEIDL